MSKRSLVYLEADLIYFDTFSTKNSTDKDANFQPVSWNAFAKTNHVSSKDVKHFFVSISSSRLRIQDHCKRQHVRNMFPDKQRFMDPKIVNTWLETLTSQNPEVAYEGCRLPRKSSISIIRFRPVTVKGWDSTLLIGLIPPSSFSTLSFSFSTLLHTVSFCTGITYFQVNPLLIWSMLFLTRSILRQTTASKTEQRTRAEPWYGDVVDTNSVLPWEQR